MALNRKKKLQVVIMMGTLFGNHYSKSFIKIHSHKPSPLSIEKINTEYSTIQKFSINAFLLTQ